MDSETSNTTLVDTNVVTQNDQYPKKFPSVIERYYTEKFALDVSGPGEDQYVYCHSNGLFVIGLAPSHPIVRSNKPVKQVIFQSEHRDLSKNTVRGAKKKGGARMRPDGTLAKIICDDGTEYIARCCIDALLLEVNAQLSTRPELLNTMADTQGYLAIFQPLHHDSKDRTEGFLSLEEYKAKRFSS